MMKRRLILILALIAGIIIILPACAKSDYQESVSDTSYNRGSTESNMDKDDADMPEDSRESIQEEGLTGSSGITMGESEELSMEKTIRRVNMDVETLEFDILVGTIKEKVDSLGGYIEQSDIKGKSYYSSRSNRYGMIVARIPKDKVDEFISVVEEDEHANIVNSSEDLENVTLQYVDVESRKKSLEIEQERLFELLEKADSVENIISLESRLSSIRYELQNYGTQLRTYDNEVDYSTITISIDEVERITYVKKEKLNVWDRIGNGFSDTMYNISEGFQNFFVWLVVNLPFIIIWAAILIGGFLIIKRPIKKYRKRLEPKKGEQADNINSHDNSHDKNED